MTLSNESNQMTPIEHQINIDWSALDDWSAKQLNHVLDYCAEHNWQVTKVSQEQSRVMAPVISVWQITFIGLKGPKSIWVIAGDLPIDSISVEASSTARDALLVFSRKFLQRAQHLKRQPISNGEEQKLEGSVSEEAREQMQRLVKAAADLLVLYHEQEIWT